jgi:hypothetical protein
MEPEPERIIPPKAAGLGRPSKRKEKGKVAELVVPPYEQQFGA